MTNRVIPSGMISRIDRAISPPSPARTRIRRLTNRRKIQTRAASTAAANKEIRNANGSELFASSVEGWASQPPRSFVFRTWQVSWFWWLLAAALERCSCLSKSFTATKKCSKIMSPVSTMKPYFVSECRAAGFIRTLLSGLARSTKTS